jgi:RNA polymerase-binding protein DksA
MPAGDAHEGEVELARQRLLERRRVLLIRWKNEAEEEEALLEVREPDWEDLATEQRDGTLLHRLGDAEVRELGEIIAALHRIDEGSYGRCESCGQAIGADRLAVLPATRLCADCAQDAAEPPPPPPGEE